MYIYSWYEYTYELLESFSHKQAAIGLRSIVNKPSSYKWERRKLESNKMYHTHIYSLCNGLGSPYSVPLCSPINRPGYILCKSAAKVCACTCKYALGTGMWQCVQQFLCCLQFTLSAVFHLAYCVSYESGWFQLLSTGGSWAQAGDYHWRYRPCCMDIIVIYYCCDVRLNLMFWSNYVNDTIYQANLDESNPTITDVNRPSKYYNCWCQQTN